MSQLTIKLFGPPQAALAGKRLDLDHRKPMALLAYLCLTGQRYSRDMLATQFWPESETARKQLRNSLSILRKALGASFADWVAIDREGVNWLADSDTWIDVVEFQRRLDGFRTHDHPSDELCAACVDHLTKAVALYGDDFLAGFTLRDSPAFDEWCYYQREHLRSELAIVLAALVEHHEKEGEFDVAIRHARRRLTLDSLNEPVHRQLMHLYARSGHQTLAIRQYRECERILGEELGVRPDGQTLALFEEVKRRRPAVTMPAGPTPISEQSSPVSVSSEGKIGRVPHRYLPNNLSTPLTPLIGRDQERRSILAILAQPHVRLLTLSGPGGVGKTRLSRQVASDLCEQSASDDLSWVVNGIFFVSLAPVLDTRLVASTIAETLDIREVQHRSILASLQTALRSKRMLLVLDNYEHVLSAAPLVTELLRACPHLKVLVTSREMLRLSGEHEYVVAPLALPPLTSLGSGVNDNDESPAAKYSAVELFRQRAVAARHDFVLDAANGPAVTDLCVRLDGLPLAIELAAARVKHFSVQNLLSRLNGNGTGRGRQNSGSLHFLKSDIRDKPERHRSLWAAIEWSYGLLEEEEQILFRRLAIFVGGWSADAAQAICGKGLSLDTSAGLASLLDKSLVQRMENDGDLPRFTMLETLREFGLEKLRQQGELVLVQQQTASYFADLAEQYNAQLFGPNDATFRELMHVEHANIRAVTNWTLSTGEVDIALRLCAALLHFWNEFPKEAEQIALATVALAEGNPPSTRYAEAIVCAGYFSHILNRGEAVRRFMMQGLEMNAATGNMGDHRIMGIARGLLAWAAFDQGDYENARVFFDKDLAWSRQTGDDWTLAMTLVNYGRAATKLGEYERAEHQIWEALSLHRHVGQAWGIAMALADWSLLCVRLGRFEDALDALAEGRQLAEDNQLKDRMSQLSRVWGLLAMGQDDFSHAEICLREALHMQYELGGPKPLIATLDIMTQLAIRRGNPEKCLRLAAAAQSARIEFTLTASPVEKAEIDEAVAQARNALPNHAAATAWAEGEGMALDAAVEHALASAD